MEISRIYLFPSDIVIYYYITPYRSALHFLVCNLIACSMYVSHLMLLPIFRCRVLSWIFPINNIPGPALHPLLLMELLWAVIKWGRLYVKQLSICAEGKGLTMKGKVVVYYLTYFHVTGSMLWMKIRLSIKPKPFGNRMRLQKYLVYYNTILISDYSYQPPHTRRRLKIQEFVAKYEIFCSRAELLTSLFQ